MNVRVGEDFWCEIDGLSGVDQVQGDQGNEFIKCKCTLVQATNSSKTMTVAFRLQPAQTSKGTPPIGFDTNKP